VVVLTGSSRPDQLASGFGIGEYDNAGLHDASSATRYSAITNVGVTADLNIVDGLDLDGDGATERWGVSMRWSPDFKMVFYRDPTAPGTFSSFKRTVTAEAGTTLPTSELGFGAGWTYQNELYMSSNAGHGVYVENGFKLNGIGFKVDRRNADLALRPTLAL